MVRLQSGKMKQRIATWPVQMLVQEIAENLA
jgi:hypothetical protein